MSKYYGLGSYILILLFYSHTKMQLPIATYRRIRFGCRISPDEKWVEGWKLTPH